MLKKRFLVVMGHFGWKKARPLAYITQLKFLTNIHNNIQYCLFSGRPIRPKETGLTEEELTEEIVTSSGQKIFKCKKCEKEFSFSSRLKRHLLVHTGARPFECPICLRRFTQAVDLKRHMLRHSGQKPHVCQYCGKQYTRGDRLKVNDEVCYRVFSIEYAKANILWKCDFSQSSWPSAMQSLVNHCN